MSEEEIFSALEEGDRWDTRPSSFRAEKIPYYTDEILVKIVQDIRDRYKDVAITLSIVQKQGKL